ncbi:MAG: 50S ribosomal protein L23 [Amoebophilaceae bacterium]|jgi:large subunit ribosomal protein L23|nr:50S ribosomal protein L23 [Amoebophilaceae bacterium]
MNILKKPLITEKVSSLNGRGVYGLVVDKRANKIEIKKKVEEIYGVIVSRVNTMQYAGKRKTRHTKLGISRGKQPAYKKALITLRKGESIDFYKDIH